MKQLLYTLLFSIIGIAGIFGQGYTIDKFDVNINITEDGKMEIKENISVNFLEQRRGIFRVIPFKYNLNGKKYTTPISGITIPNHNKNITTEGSNKRIRIGSENIYLNGPQQYEINYKIDNAIIEYEDGQEIYWNLTGNAWDTKLNNITFKVSFPKTVQLDSQFIKVYTGYENSTESDAEYSFNGREIVGEITRSLNFSEGVTIAVKLPLGYLKDLPKFDELKISGIDKTKNKPWYLAIPLVLWGLVWQWWRNRKNSNKTEGPVEQKFYPPKGLTSAHVGAYIDHKVQQRDVISLIPYWATEGFIKVRGLEDGDMQLIRLKELPTDFPAYEKDFFNAIFIDGDAISFSDAQHKFGPSYNAARKALVKEIENAGYYDPSYVWLFKSWRWPVICTLIIVVGFLLLVFQGYLIFGIGLMLLGILFFGFVFFTAPLSEYGQEVHDHLVGLKDFLENGGEDDISRLNAEDENYFSHMLPYAVAFGLDEQWLKTYETYYDTAPFWFETYYMGAWMRPTFGTFSKGFEVKEITKAFTSYPEVTTTSTGGGFSSGGGFSGGGFGGGGGGSW